MQLLIKPIFTLAMMALAVVVVQEATAASGAEAKEAKGLAPQTLCPVTWQKIDKSIFVDAAGHRIYVCCRRCLALVEAQPTEYIQKLLAKGQQPEVLPAADEVCILPPTQARLDYKAIAPESFEAMLGLEKCVKQSGLEPSLLVLVKLRASQINGCHYCLDMHAKEAHLQGETEQRLAAVSAWRKSTLFSERERAALAWAEAVTLVADTHVPDDVYTMVAQQFTEKERVNLTLAIVAINGWNRLNVAFQTVPGS